MGDDEGKKFVRKRASQLNPAASVLQSLLKSSKSPLSNQFIRWQLWNEWETVVGAEIAKHTMPVGFLGGTLYVWVKNAARMQELVFICQPLREKINDHIGASFVKFIRFTLDRKSVPSPQESEEGLREFLSKQPPSEDGEPQPGP